MKIILFLLSLCFGMAGSLYDYAVQDTDGHTVNLGDFRGKKILFVNTASASPYAAQLGSLEQLYQQYKDSLVVIAVPSNTFKSEPLSDAAIKSLATGTYGAHYILTRKTEVAGAGQSPVYYWLTHRSENGMMENSVNEDFYKFLVNGEGKLVGIFAPSVDPLSDEMQEAIKN